MTSRQLVPFLLLAAACTGSRGSDVNATANASTPPATVAAEPSPAGPSIAAEIVTIDASAPSLTLREGDVPALTAPGPKDLKPTDRTIRVEATAATDLTGLKPGQKVQVTCSSAPTVVTGPGGATATGVSGSGRVSASAPPAAGSSGPPPDLARCDSIVRIAALEPPAP
jgi:hypothetical protein